jgi:hypothetical protein
MLNVEQKDERTVVLFDVRVAGSSDAVQQHGRVHPARDLRVCVQLEDKFCGSHLP